MAPFSKDNDVQPNPTKRRRLTRSCQECRRRKVKCNRLEPCGHCIFSKKQCHYGHGAAQARRTGNERAPAGQIVNGSAPVVNATPPQASASAAEPNPPSDSLRCTAYAPDAQVTAHRSSDVAKSPVRGRTTHIEPNSIDSGRQDVAISLNKSRVFGQSHWSNSTLELQKTAALLNPETENALGNESLARLKWEIGVLLQKCKVVSRSIKSHRASASYPDPRAYPSIAKIITDQMACLYVTRFESVFRILHIPSFWRDYEKYWACPTEAEAILRLKIQLVTALGISIHQTGIDTPDFYSISRQYLYAAQDWLSGPLKKNRISITGLQIQCLLALARQALAVGGDVVWISMGTVIRTAMQMGLHRDPKHFKRMDILEAEVRRRLWATVLELDVQAALDAGAPPTISIDRYDTEAPSNVNDKDIDGPVNALPECPATMITDSSLQRFLFQVLRPRLEVARLMNGIASDSSEIRYNDFVALTATIAHACRSLGAYTLRTHDPNIACFHSNLADLFLRRFILQIHRPLAGKARTNPLYYYSRKMSLDSAMALLSPAPKSTEFEHLALLGAGIFKNRMIHASLAVASEILMEIEEQAPLEHHLLPQEPSSYLKMLTAALREGLRQSAERIRLGETNVKLHMKLSMALRQSEMAGETFSFTQQLVQSAKESLEESYATILERAASEGVGIASGGNSGLSEQFELNDFDPENFPLVTDINLDDLFFLPTDLDVAGHPQV